MRLKQGMVIADIGSGRGRMTVFFAFRDGRLFIVEHDPVKTGQSNSESTSQSEITSQMSEAGYKLIKIDTELLERDNVYFFKIRDYIDA